MPFAELPIEKINAQLPIIIQQWLPFGRDSGRRHLEILLKPMSTSKGMWMRSKPKLEVQIKEEVRMAACSTTSECKTDVYGTVFLNADSDVDFNGRKLQLLFPRLTKLPKLLFHPTVFFQSDATTSSNNGCFISFQNLPERIFNLCHYSAPMQEPPIQSALKIRTTIPNKSSIFIQLHISPIIVRGLNRLEVRFLVPTGSRILRTLTPANHNLGPVSLIKDGCAILWNLTPLITSSSNNKLKEDMALNLDVEMDASSETSLLNSQVLVIYPVPTS